MSSISNLHVNYALVSLVVFLISCNFVLVADAELVSHWNFNNNLDDSGKANNSLRISTPIFHCDDPLVTFQACWPQDYVRYSSASYVPTPIDDGFHFNRLTYLATDPLNESDYDFFDIDHEFTIDFWASGEAYCPDHCTHQYLFSKANTVKEGNHVIGVAGGVQRDGALYIYFRNDHEQVYAQTNVSVFDGNPHKYTITYSGTGMLNDIKFFVDGKNIPLHPPTGDSRSLPKILDPVSNDVGFVIGNYWYTFGQTFGDGWIDEFKLYNHAFTSQDVLDDFLSQFPENYVYELEKETIPSSPKISENYTYEISYVGEIYVLIVFGFIATILSNFLIIRYYLKQKS